MKKIRVNSTIHGVHYCLVDDNDFDWLNKYSWYLLKSYNSVYAITNIDRKKVLMHRLILGLTNSTILGDHKDRNGLNNQRSNLRTCTKAENNRNINSHRDSTSKYIGVCWDSTKKKWKSAITFKGRSIFLGRYHSEKDAALAYNKKAVELFKEFANPNIL